MKAQTQPVRLPVPAPGPGQVLIRIISCGICRTDLHVIDGELERPELPLVPGQLIGVPWLGYTCGPERSTELPYWSPDAPYLPDARISGRLPLFFGRMQRFRRSGVQ